MNEKKNSAGTILLAILKNRILPFLLPASMPNIGMVLLGTFSLSYLIQWAWTSFSPDKLFYDKTSLIGYAIITLVRILALLLVYVLITEHYHLDEHYTWGRNPGLGVFFMSFLVGIPAFILSSSAHNLFIFLELKLENPIPSQLYYYVTSENSMYSSLLLLVVGCVLPVLIEELFFRGLLYSVLPDKWWIRIPVPALIGALFAVNQLEFIPFLIIGLCASMVRYYTDCTFCSIIARFCLFCMSILLSDIMPYQDPELVQNAIDFDRTTLYSSLIGLLIGFVMLLVLLRQLWYVRYSIKNEDKACDSEDGKPLAVPLHDHFHIDFFLGSAFLILCWITL